MYCYLEYYKCKGTKKPCYGLLHNRTPFESIGDMMAYFIKHKPKKEVKLITFMWGFDEIISYYRDEKRFFIENDNPQYKDMINIVKAVVISVENIENSKQK